MSNRTVRRQDGLTDSTSSGTCKLIVTGLTVALTVCPSGRLSAQVGHDPQHSPFQDVTTHQTFTPFISQFFGNRAQAGVGAQAGLAVGGRFATALSGPLELWATFAVINSRRNVIDPSLPDSTRVSGPIDYRLVSADLGIALNVTGQKTWHGLSPYVGIAFGVVAPTSTVTDTSGYQANSNITFVPTIGTRVRIGRILSLTVEARDNLMRYEWPCSFFGPTIVCASTTKAPAVLDPNTERDAQMTHNFTLTAGLSFHFNF